MLIQRQSAGGVELATPASRIKRGPAGRATPGSGPATLHAALSAAGGPLPPKDLRAELAKHGMSPKSISGVLDRAKRDGIIKASGDGYVLTAKAQRMNGAEGVEHG